MTTECSTLDRKFIAPLAEEGLGRASELNDSHATCELTTTQVSHKEPDKTKAYEVLDERGAHRAHGGLNETIPIDSYI